MNQSSGISVQREPTIEEFIHMLANEDELQPKTVKEYASDLKHFIEWYKENTLLGEKVTLRIEDVDTSTLVHYREDSHKVMLLKPATINRRLITLKRFFKWAVLESRLNYDPSKALKFIPEDKVSPRRMTSEEEEAFLAAVEYVNSLRDRTILTLMFHTGLRTMEVCNLTPGDIELGRRSAYLTVRADKRNREPGLEGLSSHDLRHRFGYAMAEHTPLHRLAEMMGHTNPDTTMIYIKALSTNQR
uniref:Integrase n=1 Tax=Caenorhabditis japonica TaxID=281687 RepID=A0A8R1INB4_CAEJA